MKIRMLVGLAYVCYGAATLCVSAEEPKEGKPEVATQWNGIVKDENLRDLAPADGYVADHGRWVTLWKAWRPGEELAEVDFSNEIVLVATVDGPNRTMGRPNVDDGGNVMFRVASTKMAGPGFGYMLAKVKADRVETINGRPVDVQPTAAVVGTFLVPDGEASFDESVVQIRLYKIHPLLADAPATLVDMVEIKNFSHTKGKSTKTEFLIGGMEKLDPNLRYYLTLFILRDGQRTHIGEVPGSSLCSVLTNGGPRTVHIRVRHVR